MNEDQKRRTSDRFHVSREIRLTEILSAVIFIGGLAAVWFTNDNRIGNLEKGQARQESTNNEIKNSIREVGTDVKELSGSVRRMEGIMTRRRDG